MSFLLLQEHLEMNDIHFSSSVSYTHSPPLWNFILRYFQVSIMCFPHLSFWECWMSVSHKSLLWGVFLLGLLTRLRAAGPQSLSRIALLQWSPSPQDWVQHPTTLPSCPWPSARMIVRASFPLFPAFKSLEDPLVSPAAVPMSVTVVISKHSQNK